MIFNDPGYIGNPVNSQKKKIQLEILYQIYIYIYHSWNSSIDDMTEIAIPAAAALVPEGNPSHSALPGSSRCACLPWT